MFDIVASIVLYNNDKSIEDAIKSFTNTDLKIKLVLIDNSPTDKLKYLASDSRIEYIFNNNNVGFGAGHNIGILKYINLCKYYLVLNPDIVFNKGVLEKLCSYIETRKDIGILSPKVLYMDGSLQYLCRKLPTPVDFFAKRLIPSLFKKRIESYEFRDKDYNQTMNVPFISGCFMFIRSEALKKVGLFDEKIFMYTEDIDLSRRINKYYKNIYYPEVFIYHGYARESATNFKLLLIAIKSSLYYFSKWGWFFDKERKTLNMSAGKIYE